MAILISLIPAIMLGIVIGFPLFLSNREHKRYFICSYVGLNGNENVFGSARIIMDNGKYINNSIFREEMMDRHNFTNVIILSITELSEKDYNAFNF